MGKTLVNCFGFAKFAKVSPATVLHYTVSIDAYANLAMDGVVAVYAASVSSLTIVVFASIVIGNCNTNDLKAEHRVE